MSDEKSTVADEIDCEVTVQDGSWMTCDMITDDESDNLEDAPTQGSRTTAQHVDELDITGSNHKCCRAKE